MKLIEIGRCVNNKDPLGLGRIRVEHIEKINSSIERSVEYKEWDVNDPFVYNPFLPVQINVVPKENQVVKMFVWDTANQSQNREYISGPFINAYDFDGQGIDRQLQNTTRGIRIKKEPHLYKETGEIIDAQTKGVVGNPADHVQYGNYGTDIIYTRNGVTIRAGKLDDEKYRQTQKPIAYNKLARFSVKKYDSTIELKEKDVVVDELQHKPLTTLVEYEVYNIGSVDTLFSGVINCYKIKNHVYNLTDTFYFDQNKEVGDDNKALIYSKSFSGATLEQIGRDISQELRKIDVSETQFDLNPEFFKVNTHPFYYKPSKSFFDSLTTDQATLNAQKLYSYINLGTTNAFGLSYSTLEKYVPSKKVNKTIKEQNKVNKPTTIGSMISDMIYLLSYEANVPNDADKINFAKLNNYELTQEEILEEILPKTFSGVRGEPLLYLLELMVKWMITHIHNPAEVGIGPEGLKDEMLKELQSAKDKIINQKLRIN
jgi:hypothetical protein